MCFCTKISSRGHLTFIENNAIIGFCRSEGCTLLQISITVASGGVAQHKEYLVGTCCHKACTFVLGTQYDDIKATIAPIHRSTVLTIAHRDVEGTLCCGKLRLIHLEGIFSIAHLVHLYVLLLAIRQVAGCE